MLNAILKKLQYKLQPEILLVDAPHEFVSVVSDWKKTAAIQTDAVQGKHFNFAVVFVKTIKDVSAASRKYVKLLEPDAVFWMVYPKKTSKKYKSDITRDNGWQALGEMGYEGVSMISIDDDWSAFRFRKPDFIKTLKRRESMTLTEAGKSRAKASKIKK